MKTLKLSSILGWLILCFACDNAAQKKIDSTNKKEVSLEELELVYAFNTDDQKSYDGFELKVPSSGRYRLRFYGSADTNLTFWLEDYIDNQDGRQYDISGSLELSEGTAQLDGSPLAKGKHKMKLHLPEGMQIDSLQLSLIQEIPSATHFHLQSMKGDEWELVWSDEFENTGLPDSSKWSYNIGNWGWGNKELQYYTEAKVENAEVKDGKLFIRAIKDEKGNWTSARLSTQGKSAFQYGKIEFMARVPSNRGLWSAGWLLGNDYEDELSWPYCGEIDILECVGYEIDDESGNGINHATCHTPKYYFKKNNQIGNEIKVEDMSDSFHSYSIEWDSSSIRAYLDGEHYYTYDKNQDSLEWPFHKPQNIIVNLAVGGGWGGQKGIDPTFSEAEYILDYIRVYQRK